MITAPRLKTVTLVDPKSSSDEQFKWSQQRVPMKIEVDGLRPRSNTESEGVSLRESRYVKDELETRLDIMQCPIIGKHRLL